MGALADIRRRSICARAGGGGAPVLPVTTGLIGRYDFGDAATIAATGSAISTMDPAEGAGPQLTGAGGFYDAANGRWYGGTNGTDVSGGTGQLNAAYTWASAAHSAFMVVEQDGLPRNNSQNTGVFSSTLSGTSGAYNNGYLTVHGASLANNYVILGDSPDVGGLGIQNDVPKNVWGQVFPAAGGSQIDVYFEGVSDSSATRVGSPPGNNNFAIGKGRNSGSPQVWVYEVIAYDRAVSPAEAAEIIAYLNAKHGIS